MARRQKVLQFESDRESVAWSIMIGPIAAASEDLDEAVADVDELILMWRERRRALDDHAPDEEEDE